MRTKWLCLVSGPAVVALGLLTGCKTGQYMAIGPQTHFDYPNSNVTPLAPVKVKVSGPSSFLKSPDIVSSDSDIKVENAALAQVPGADLITDYAKLYKAYMFWPFSWSTLELEGTAAKMEVGRQDISR